MTTLYQNEINRLEGLLSGKITILLKVDNQDYRNVSSIEFDEENTIQGCTTTNKTKIISSFAESLQDKISKIRKLKKKELCNIATILDIDVNKRKKNDILQEILEHINIEN